MEDDNEYLKLPVDERCQHKLWKARVNGYEAAAKLFNQIADEKSPEWSKYLGLVKKFVTDGNALAQEKGLEAVLVYVENASCAGKTCGEVMNGIVGKCLGAPKAKTKEKAQEIALMYVEIERAEIVQDELTKGLGGKAPKVVVACVQTLRDALHQFGPKVITLKPLVKQLPAMLEDRDKGVRDEAKLLTVEIYRWIGAAIRPPLATLKPVQLTELEAEFEKVANDKAVPTRYLRSQQDLRAKMAQQAINNKADADNRADEVDDNDAEVLDPYDAMQPIEIMSRLPKDFAERCCEAKKWQDRKETVDSLLQLLAGNPRLEPDADYGDIVRALRRAIAKDSNVMVVAAAGRSLAALAAGLRKRFQQYVGQCFHVVLEKFKEKKQNVVLAMREAVDAMYLCSTLDALQEDLLTSLDNKNPSVKTETASFIARAFAYCDSTSLGKKQLKAYCPALVKALNDNDKMVRDAAAEAIGTAMKVVGDKFIQSFVQDVENIKMAKVKECCDRCELPSRNRKQKTTSANVAGVFTAKSVNESKHVDDSSAANTAASAPQRLLSSAPPLKAAAKAVVKGGKSKKCSSAAPTAIREAPEERELTVEEVEEVAASILPPEVVSGLADATWNTRLSAMELFSETVRALGDADVPTQALVRILVAKPGLKESNFQVLKLKLDILTRLASSSSFSRRSASYVLDDLAEKLGDSKNGTGAAEALTAIADATSSLDHVALRVLDLVMAQKSPKNQSEALNWLISAIKAFGLVVQVKPIVDHVKKALNATNPAVRTSAISLLGVMFLYVGPSLRVLFENEKAAILQQIDAEFDKLQDVSPPLPTRGLSPKSNEGAGRGRSGAGGGGGSINVADLIPRSDISEHLQGTLIDELSDKDWKVRLEAMQKLQSIVGDAKFIVPNLGNLPTVLKARMADSNKNLAIQAINICQAIGMGMGPNCSKYVRILATSMIAGLGDSKNTVRSAATSCLNAWVEQCGIEQFFDAELVSDSLKLENPNLRIELYGWLGEHLPGARSVPVAELVLCVPCLYAALEDRNVDVRKKAQEAVLPFMIHLGYEQMSKAASNLKPMSRSLVVSHLDKAKSSMPAAASALTTGGPKSVRGGGGGRVTKATSPQGDGETAAFADGNTSDETRMATGKGRASTTTASSRVTSKTKIVCQTSKVSGVMKRGTTEDADTSPPIVANNMKEQRIQDEQRLKVLKWNFTTPRDEFYELLKEQMITAGFSRTLLTQLFHNDFKFHIRALETFQECLENCPEASVANADLILKWLALRFFDTNPSVILKALEYLQALFALLATNLYHLHECEGASFVPYLVTKTGDPKDAVRNSVRHIFKLIYKVYPANKVFVHLMEGLKSKNARQRTECLDELGCLIEMYGMSVCQPNPSVALKDVAKQISDRDNGVRNAALNCVVQAYFLDGERIYKHIGAISDKDMGLLEERIKRASKNRRTPSQTTLKSSQQQGPSSSPVIGKSPSPESVKAKSMSPRPVSSQVVAEEPLGIVRRIVPGKGQMVRPVSGAFSLDLDKLDQESSMEREVVVLPELFKPDLDDFSEPVRLPETKMRPPSPATKILNNSQDAACAMDLVISQVASNDATVSVQALAQIDEFLRDEDRADSMSTRVDQLLVAASLQFRLAHARVVSGSSSSSSQTDLVCLYRCLTMTVMTLFQNGVLARRASRDVLRDLVHVLVSVLLDARLVDLNESGLGGGSDGANVVRAINVLVVKLVERSDHTNMMGALIRLLHDCVANDNALAKFTELIMKCVWKIVRLLPTIINEINLDRVLLDLHLFLVAFPSSHWRGRSSDMPLRTIKTVLHTLAKQKGNKIMSHLTLIGNPQDSEMECYLRKVLKGGVKHRSSVGGNNNDDSSENNASLARRDSRHSPRRLSKTTHETLAEIFKKIGSKETTREGLADLYAFKKRHPEADIEPFLSKSSQFFQSYIERGLLNIEQEREGSTNNKSRFSGQLNKQSGLSNSTGSIHSACMLDEHSSTAGIGAGAGIGASTDDNGGVFVAEGNPAVYLERLKLIRAQCGLDNSKYDRLGVGVVSVSAASRAAFSKASSVSGSLEYSQSRIKDDMTFIRQRQEETIVMSHVTHSCSSEGLSTVAGGPVEDLKRRLDRIKMGAKI